MKKIYILLAIVISHALLYLNSTMSFVIAFIISLGGVLFIIKSRDKVSLFFSFLFSVQLAHVILRKTTYPFSNVGMYSWINPSKKTTHHFRNLYNKNGELISTNSGLLVGELDDIESKLVTRLLRNKDEKIDELIQRYYSGSFIE